MTDLVYLSDTYLFTDTATAIAHDLNEFGEYLVLDRTIFYPQGGGQPSDKGQIFNAEFEFEVEKCLFVEDKVVNYGKLTKGDVNLNTQVTLKIDAERRRLNARNHTAGHLIDLVLKEFFPKLTPVKGYHFPEGPYVEYTGNIQDSATATSLLTEKLLELIKTEPKISFEVVQDINHPSGKPMRIMKMESFDSMPCGGTHVKNLSEIGKIRIRKIKNTRETVRIAYQVSD
jgi:alanyl-tRNA synthetase